MLRLVFQDDIKKIWACLGVCRGRLVISQVSIRSLMKESVQRDYRSQLASHNTGPWCSGQGWRMQTMCRVTIITHPLFIRPFQKPDSDAELRWDEMLNLKLLLSWFWIFCQKWHSRRAWLSYCEHVTRVSVWTQVPIDRRLSPLSALIDHRVPWHLLLVTRGSSGPGPV